MRFLGAAEWFIILYQFAEWIRIHCNRGVKRKHESWRVVKSNRLCDGLNYYLEPVSAYYVSVELISKPICNQRSASPCSATDIACRYSSPCNIINRSIYCSTSILSQPYNRLLVKRLSVQIKHPGQSISHLTQQRLFQDKRLFEKSVFISYGLHLA